jgi:hypothetical protein
MQVLVEGFVRKRQPVILVDTGVCQNRFESFADFAARGAGVTVTVRAGTPAPAYAEPDARPRMAASEFVARHVAGASCGNAEPVYVANHPLSDSDLARLGIAPPPCFPGQTFDTARLWIGPAGTASHLHIDQRDGLACLYLGRKRFWLYPPSERRRLYTRGRAPARSGVVDPRSPDLVRFPGFAHARHSEIVLEPGEILYLPAGWGHFVENIDDTLMVNFWPRKQGFARIRGHIVSALLRLVRGVKMRFGDA